MARPCKSASLLTESSQTKEEINFRIEQEEKLKGKSDNIKPSSYLNKRQKRIFKNIVKELEASGILGNVDVYILNTCAISIDRIQTIETSINEDPELITDKDLRMSAQRYTQEFFRCCNELSLSPQSRAKLSNVNLEQSQNMQDPLLAILGGDR